MLATTLKYRVNHSRWWLQAACLGKDAEQFFASGKLSAEVKACCDGCNVKPECLLDALQKRDEFGVRGGLRIRARNKLVKKIAAAGLTLDQGVSKCFGLI